MTVLSSGDGTQGVSLKYRLSLGKRVAGVSGGGIFPQAGNGTLSLPNHAETLVLHTCPSNSPLRLALSVLPREEGGPSQGGVGWAQEAEAVFLGEITPPSCIYGAFFKDFIYLFLERGKGGREGEKH